MNSCFWNLCYTMVIIPLDYNNWERSLYLNVNGLPNYLPFFGFRPTSENGPNYSSVTCVSHRSSCFCFSRQNVLWSFNLSSHQIISGTFAILSHLRVPSNLSMLFSKSHAQKWTWYPRYHLTKNVMRPLIPKSTGFLFILLAQHCVGLLTITSHCWLILSWWSFKSLRYFSHDFLPRQSPPLYVFAICFLHVNARLYV